jgi:hypothetical protein
MAGRCGVQWEATPAIYREEEAIRGENILPATLAAVQQGGAAARSVQEKSRVDSAGEVPSGIRGAMLWDMTRQAASWAMAATSGGVERSALAVVEMTGRAGE